MDIRLTIGMKTPITAVDKEGCRVELKEQPERRGRNE